MAYLVAWRDDAPLGSGLVQWGGCVGPNARDAFSEAVEFNHLQVRSEFRGQGVGTHLISTAEALAWHRGRPQVGVGVADDNPEAERLYVRLGYRPTGIVDVSEYDSVTDEGQPPACEGAQSTADEEIERGLIDPAAFRAPRYGADD